MERNDNSSFIYQSLWNSAAGIINALEAVIMTFMATHFMGIEVAGELTIAFAVGNLFRTIGLWGTRNFQISDQKKEFKFSEYLLARSISILVMVFICIGYLTIIFFERNNDLDKIITISLILMSFSFDCFEDVIWGEYQRRGRIDVGAKLFIVRWGCLLITYCSLVILFR